MRELAAARRPLILGIGGGGDVVGALAVAEHCRLFHGADPIVGGVAWERLPIDPQPGPRRADEIEGATQIAPGVLAASAATCIRASGIRFAESRVAEMLGVQTALVDVTLGPARIADGLATAVQAVEADLVIFLDVGGDVLGHGDEPGLASPLCDAVMLAAADLMSERGIPVLGAIFGIGCDGELTPGEVFERLGEVAAAGGLAGALGIVPEVAELLEQVVEAVPTEASAQAVRAFRGDVGEFEIRGGRRKVLLSPAAAVTFFFQVPQAMASAARLAQAVRGAADLDSADAILRSLGVHTELEWEQANAKPGGD
jgi:hypothetical protein